MKSLIQYLNESLLLESVRLFKMNASNAQNAFALQDKLKSFLNTAKKRYSLTDKTDVKQLFNDFVKYPGVKLDWLKEFDLIGRGEGTALAELLIIKREELEKDHWNLKCIKTFDESEREREYKAWKNSADYVEGRPLDKKEAEKDMKDVSEEELKRTLVVYDYHYPGNPDTTLQYDFYGKRNRDRNQRHQANMIKVDWHYRTGLKYYDARTILLNNYLKKTEAELAERSFIDDSDLQVGD